MTDSIRPEGYDEALARVRQTIQGFQPLNTTSTGQAPKQTAQLVLEVRRRQAVQIYNILAAGEHAHTALDLLGAPYWLPPDTVNVVRDDIGEAARFLRLLADALEGER